MEDIFRRLSGAHVNRRDLAWDFTVASAHSLSGRLLGIRDDAFRALGDKNLGDLKVKGASPRFSLSKVSNFAPAAPSGCQAGEDDIIQRRVEGTVEVPCYLDQPGAAIALQARAGRPALRTPGQHLQRQLHLQHPALGHVGHAGRVSLYGHGLFGGAGEVNSISRLEIASKHRVVLCAADWIGMSGGDVANTITILRDLSGFPELADRLQQGMLDFLFLGRTMIHRRASRPASPSGTRAAR